MLPYVRDFFNKSRKICMQCRRLDKLLLYINSGLTYVHCRHIHIVVCTTTAAPCVRNTIRSTYRTGGLGSLRTATKNDDGDDSDQRMTRTGISFRDQRRCKSVPLIRLPSRFPRGLDAKIGGGGSWRRRMTGNCRLTDAMRCRPRSRWPYGPRSRYVSMYLVLHAPYIPRGTMMSDEPQ